jgi:hypothetical protein
MKKNKTSISNARAYSEIGDFWDVHDLSEHWNNGKDVSFDVKLETEIFYCPLEKKLSEAMQYAARRHGVSVDALVNMWLQEKILEETSTPK